MNQLESLRLRLGTVINNVKTAENIAKKGFEFNIGSNKRANQELAIQRLDSFRGMFIQDEKEFKDLIETINLSTIDISKLIDELICSLK